MTDPVIRGWCPGALRPMQSGDGLVVRVRPPMGRLSRAQAHGLAAAALSHGNGMIEMTTRANLQIRGVSDAALPGLQADLRALGLLDASPRVEARRNIVLSPFRASARDHEALAKAITQGLAAPDMPQLPGKFGFVVDADVPLRHLPDISGDIRIESAGNALIVRADGAALGRKVTGAAGAVALALDMARWFAGSGGIGADGRGRMRQHLTGGAELPRALAGDTEPNPPAPPAHPGHYGGGFCVGAAFGQLPAHRLGWLADRAQSGLFVTPFRMLHLEQPTCLPEIMAARDLITAPQDPMMRVFACTGAPGCPQALSTTRDLARDLACSLPGGQVLHVSGCAKGCAHPAAADLTLTATAPGRFDLIRHGRACDAPDLRALSAAQLTETNTLTEAP